MPYVKKRYFVGFLILIPIPCKAALIDKCLPPFASSRAFRVKHFPTSLRSRCKARTSPALQEGAAKQGTGTRSRPLFWRKVLRTEEKEIPHVIGKLPSVPPSSLPCEARKMQASHGVCREAWYEVKPAFRAKEDLFPRHGKQARIFDIYYTLLCKVKNYTLQSKV